MRKTKTVKVIEEKLETEDVICDRCLSSLKTDWGYEGLVGAYAFGGYGSKYLGDMNEFLFDVCEKCLSDWFNTFKRDPQVGVNDEKDSSSKKLKISSGSYLRPSAKPK